MFFKSSVVLYWTEIEVLIFLVCLINSRDAFRMPLEDKKINLEESLYANIPGSQEKLQKLRELEHEKQLVLSEITKRCAYKVKL